MTLCNDVGAHGGVPQAANLTAHLELLRRTLPLGMLANYTGVAVKS